MRRLTCIFVLVATAVIQVCVAMPPAARVVSQLQVSAVENNKAPSTKAPTVVAPSSLPGKKGKDASICPVPEKNTLHPTTQSQSRAIAEVGFRRKTRRSLLLATIYIDDDSAIVELWSVETEATTGETRVTLWETLKGMKCIALQSNALSELTRLYEGGVGDEDEVGAENRNQQTAAAISPLLEAAALVARAALAGAAKEGLMFFPDISLVMFAGGTLELLPAQMGDLMYASIRKAIANYADSSHMNMFTTPLWTRFTAGTVRAVWLFLAANYEIDGLESLRFNEGEERVADPTKLMTPLYIGRNSAFVAIPVQDAILEAPVVTVSLSEGDLYLPSSKFQRLILYAGAFAYRGFESSHALLMKMLCERQMGHIQEGKDPLFAVNHNVGGFYGNKSDGICESWCANAGWNQRSVPGPLSFREDAYEWPPDAPPLGDGSWTPAVNVAPDANELNWTSAACDPKRNSGATKLQRIRNACQLVGMKSGLSTTAMQSIANTQFIVGNGNARKCSRAIRALLMQSPIPSLLQAEYTGLYLPSEVGRIFGSTASESQGVILHGLAAEEIIDEINAMALHSIESLRKMEAPELNRVATWNTGGQRNSPLWVKGSLLQMVIKDNFIHLAVSLGPSYWKPRKAFVSPFVAAMLRKIEAGPEQ
eukprot:GHVU01116838.1.p1 GENE.GHVU01116838.1~~GHVU01116838.1.p1  ORF type:complete len:652 (+),score=67.76 GHVU01116838.1:207-2162(+)